MKANGLYPITSVSKEDILTHFEDHDDYENIKKVVSKLTEQNMKAIAKRMENYYCDNGFWTDLESAYEFVTDCKERLKTHELITKMKKKVAK